MSDTSKLDPSPKIGEFVLHCGHPNAADRILMQLARPVLYETATATQRVTRWFVQCRECHALHPNDVRTAKNHAVWVGDTDINPAV